MDKEHLVDFCCGQLRVVVIIYFTYTLCEYVISVNCLRFCWSDLEERRKKKKRKKEAVILPVSYREYILQYYKFWNIISFLLFESTSLTTRTNTLEYPVHVVICSVERKIFLFYFPLTREFCCKLRVWCRTVIVGWRMKTLSSRNLVLFCYGIALLNSILLNNF